MIGDDTNIPLSLHSFTDMYTFELSKLASHCWSYFWNRLVDSLTEMSLHFRFFQLLLTYCRFRVTCKKTRSRCRRRARDPVGRLVIATAQSLPYYLAVRWEFRFVPDLKRGDGGRSPITIYLQQRPVESPPSPRGPGEAASIERDRGLDKMEERHNSICLGRADPAWGVNAAAVCTPVWGRIKMAPADSCPLITPASGRRASGKQGASRATFADTSQPGL